MRVVTWKPKWSHMFPIEASNTSTLATHGGGVSTLYSLISLLCSSANISCIKLYMHATHFI